MFNDGQRSHLLRRLRSIEEMLSEPVERMCAPGPGRVFPAVCGSATHTQRRILVEHLARVRRAMRRFLVAQQLSDASRLPSDLHALRTAIASAGIAALEIRPQHLVCYGELDPGSAEAADRLVGELTVLLTRMERLIDRDAAGDRSDGPERGKAALAAELERIVCAHGLTELRAALDAVAGGASPARFEIAVLGRRGAGKSSLLNLWLRRPLLPAGADCLTALPTRIVAGDVLRASIEPAGGPPAPIPWEEVHAYLTGSGPPGNTTGTLWAMIEVPCERLPQGVQLVDTPPIAPASVADTLAHLRDCDLGLLLIEAGSPVTGHELAVAHALLNAGGELVVALSKADRLDGQQLEQSLAATRARLERELPVAVTVAPVSTAGGQAALAERWLEETLTPRLAAHTRRASTMLGQRLSILRGAVIALLEARLRAAPSSAADCLLQGDDHTRLHERWAALRADLERARMQLFEWKLRLAHSAPAAAAAAAQTLAACWGARLAPERAIVRRLEQAFAQEADDTGRAAVQMLDSLRVQAAELLEEGSRRLQGRPCCACSEAQERAQIRLVRPRGRPVPEMPPALLQALHGRRPPGAAHWPALAGALARARVRRLRLDLLAEVLRIYGDTLYHWGREYLMQLGAQLEAAAGPARAHGCAGAAPQAQDACAIRGAIERLRSWPVNAA